MLNNVFCVMLPQPSVLAVLVQDKMEMQSSSICWKTQIFVSRYALQATGLILQDPINALFAQSVPPALIKLEDLILIVFLVLALYF